MNNQEWKRFSIYEKGLVFFFMIGLFLDVINKKLLRSYIPNDIVSYIFWLSLGLYLGFRLAKWEVVRIQKKQDENEKKDADIFSKN